MTRKILSMVLLGTMILSAGKNFTPAETEVVPVEDTPFYIGVGGTMGMVSVECDCKGGKRIHDTTNFGGLVRVGYDFSQYVGVEARFLRSRFSKNFATTTHYGIYLKPQLPLGNSTTLYGLAGWGKTKVDCDYSADPLYDKNGLSFGGGVEYDLDNKDGKKGWKVFADFQTLVKDGGTQKVRANTISTGAVYKF